MFALMAAWRIADPTSARAEEPIGKSTIVVNNVTATLPGNQEIVLREQKDVFRQEVIKASVSSSSLLRLIDNTQLAICPTTGVDLRSIDLSRQELVIYLTKGCIRSSSGEVLKHARFYTPTAQVETLGTIITITVSDRGATTVSVEEGAASVTGAGRTVTVARGQSTLVPRGAPPTPPVPTPPQPPIVSEMNRLLAAASFRDFGTRAAARSPEVEAPHGVNMFSPNVDGKIQSEIAGDATPAFGCAGSAGTLGSRGTHGACASRGTH
jgi:hypothetical protein